MSEELKPKQHWEVVNSNRLVIFDTPEDIWKRACSYFKWCDDNPINMKRTVTAGKNTGDVVEVTRRRPYTIKGLCIHCGITEEYIRDLRRTKDKDSEYYIVVSKILYIIYTDNIEHGIVGEYNAVLVSKILNLDKEELPATPPRVEIISDGVPTLLESESQILEKLESENKLFGKR